MTLVEDKPSASANSSALWRSQFGDWLNAWVRESSCPRGLRSGTNTGSSAVGLWSTKAWVACRLLQTGDVTPGRSIQDEDVPPSMSLQTGDVGGAVGVWVRWAQGIGFCECTDCCFWTVLWMVGYWSSSLHPEDGDDNLSQPDLNRVGRAENTLGTGSEKNYFYYTVYQITILIYSVHDAYG